MRYPDAPHWLIIHCSSNQCEAYGSNSKILWHVTPQLRTNEYCHNPTMRGSIVVQSCVGAGAGCAGTKCMHAWRSSSRLGAQPCCSSLAHCTRARTHTNAQACPGVLSTTTRSVRQAGGQQSQRRQHTRPTNRRPQVMSCQCTGSTSQRHTARVKQASTVVSSPALLSAAVGQCAQPARIETAAETARGPSTHAKHTARGLSALHMRHCPTITQPRTPRCAPAESFVASTSARLTAAPPALQPRLSQQHRCVAAPPRGRPLAATHAPLPAQRDTCLLGASSLRWKPHSSM